MPAYLWWYLKREAIKLHERADGFVAERLIGECIEFYNTDRLRTALAKRTPDEAYLGLRIEEAGMTIKLNTFYLSR